uniref:Uncharacterized protein n=1 Tax=Salix viminalis TaxID=40686 RepID=A0A6N2NHY8_SALVM
MLMHVCIANASQEKPLLFLEVLLREGCRHRTSHLVTVGWAFPLAELLLNRCVWEFHAQAQFDMMK